MRSKNKKEAQNSLKKQITEVFLKSPFKDYNYKQISGILQISNKTQRSAVETLIEILETENLLIQTGRGKFRMNPEKVIARSIKAPIITGTVDMKQTGKAYIISAESEEDIFITPNNTHHALHGDIVKVSLFPRRPGRKLEGEIIEIVERKKTRFVGIVSVGKRMAFLTPDDQNVPVDIMILPEDMKGARQGMKALAEITEWPEKSNNPFGVILQVLGKPGEIDVEMDSILAQYDFPLGFGKVTLRESASYNENIPDKELAKRKDFRKIFTITIDPEDAKDFDDAISYQQLENGNMEIGVHIADVSYYVKPGSAIDVEAFERGTSVYLVDRVIPMLPERLSNLLCSLRPQEDKLCFSAVFEMDKQGKIYKQWFGKTVINSDIRFNYEEVQEIIEGKEHRVKPQVLALHSLATVMRERRFSKGAINFRSREVRFILDENGKPLRAVLKEQKESNHLVEEFMLLANKKVAEWVSVTYTAKIQSLPPFVYRIHDEPSPERLHTFAEFLQKLGYKLEVNNRKKLSNSLNTLLTSINGKAEENMIETIAVRTMAKAIYSPDNIGHYGLGFTYYTHFTSPIRRYPDLLVHRLLSEYLNGQVPQFKGSLAEICKHCSDMEKKAADAERDSVKYKQVEYMAEHIGDVFDGVVSGVSKWGIFVEVDEIKAEGLVRMKNIGTDLFYLDEENYCVIGYRSQKTIRLGDKVQVQVISVDLSRKQMDMKLFKHPV